MMRISNNSNLNAPLPFLEKIEASDKDSNVSGAALPILNRLSHKKEFQKNEEIFWVKIRLKVLFRILKNNFSKMKAKVLMVLFILELLMSGVPIEALEELIEELIKEFKKDQKSINQFQTKLTHIQNLEEPILGFSDLLDLL